jgi:site-specific DNA-methyltransferase (adenine-specific)
MSTKCPKPFKPRREWIDRSKVPIMKPLSRNTLFYGDNLEILREHVPDESVDLIYLDPPFNSSRSYNVLFKDESGKDSQSQITAFEDTWHWGEDAQRTYHELVRDAPANVSTMINALRQFIGANQMMAYLVMMTARLIELHRVLKPTGSIYLHCDPTASHYLKIVMDTIFSFENLLNEVVWQRTAVKGDVHRKFGAVHDTILVYVKDQHYKFNVTYSMQDEEYRERFRFDDGDGRGPYQSAPLDSPNPRPNLTYEYKGFSPPPKGWRVSRELMEQLDRDGKLIFPSGKSGRIRRKVYLAEQGGPKVSDVWTDITPLQGASIERLGYPTQKPLALLERILESSSNEGDVILDPFCGCGTAIAASQKLNRKWIGIDITHLAISLMKYRLKDSFNLVEKKDYAVVGEPESLDGAIQLAKDDRYQFQWWAASLIQAKPLGGQSGSKEGKKGSDKGIDAVINFVEEKDKSQPVLVQVKSGHVSSRDIRDLRGVLEREGAPMGIFITLEEPSKDMTTEAVTAGYYHSKLWQRDFPTIQIVTINQLLKEPRVDLPPRDHSQTFKQAEKIKKNDATQNELF